MDKNFALKMTGVSKFFTRKKNLFQEFISPNSVKRISVLDKISFTVSPSEVVLLTGSNGSGKTTLLKILAGLILPDQGKVEVSGSYYYIPTQDRSFYERLTAKANLEFFLTLRNLSSKTIKNRIAEVGEFLKLEFLDVRYQELSTGMKQKLSIARCLAMNSDILLMDEPWRGLDNTFANQLRAQLRNFLDAHPFKTVLYITHHPREASWADRQILLENGKLNEVELLP